MTKNFKPKSPPFSPSKEEARPGGSAFRNPKSAFERGFTLIEIIIVIVILSVASAITVKFLVDSLKIYTMTANQKALYDEAKLVLERMCRDIRDAQSITSIPGDSIEFVRNNATAQDTAAETIVFQRNAAANTLEKVKSSPAGTFTMAGNVTAFTVTNASNEIQIQLTLSLTSGESITLQTKVYPKNLDNDPTNTYKNFYQNWEEERS